MWGRDFIFDPVVHPNSPNRGGGRIVGGSKLNMGIAAKRQQIEQNFVLRGIGKSWVGFRLVRISDR